MELDPELRIGIIALDPGGTTGWCASTFKAKHLSTIKQYGLAALDREILAVKWGEFKGSENTQIDRICTMVETGIDSGEVDEIIILIEGFILRQKRKDPSLLAPVRVTAKVDYANHRYWQLPLVYQQPSLAKTAMPNARLKRYKMYARGMPHARDATRHNVTLVRRCAQNINLLEKILNVSSIAYNGD